MNLYKFYRKNAMYDIQNNPNISEDDTIASIKEYVELSNTFPLIGYTVDKKTREKFINSRNMKEIREIISKHIDEEEYREFNIQHQGEFLDIYKFEGTEIVNGEIVKCEYNLPATFNEMNMMDELMGGMYLDDIFIHITQSPLILNEEYINLLWKIKYLHLYYQCASLQTTYVDVKDLKQYPDTKKYYKSISEFDMGMDFPLTIDEFLLFIKYVGDIF